MELQNMLVNIFLSLFVVDTTMQLLVSPMSDSCTYLEGLFRTETTKVNTL